MATENTFLRLSNLTLVLALASGCGARTGLGRGEPADGPSTTDAGADAAVEVGAGPPRLPHVTRLRAGAFQTCAVLDDGSLKCWGENLTDQSGVAHFPDGPKVLLVPNPIALSGVTDVSIGQGHVCALHGKDELSCWGLNDKGQLGVSPSLNHTPTPVSVAGTYRQVIAGLQNTCALGSDGKVRCFGANEKGEAGLGTVGAPDFHPRAVMLGEVTELGGGGLSWGHCAVRIDGGVSCWGAGHGAAWGSVDPMPYSVPGLSSVAHVAAADFHACAEVADGGVWCWGANADGQLAQGAASFDWTYPPVKAKGVPSFTTLACAGYQCCVIDALADVWCWGIRSSPVPVPSPVKVAGIGGRAVQVALGNGHACVLRDDDVVVCWGGNQLGQLGDGTMTDHDTPKPVVGL